MFARIRAASLVESFAARESLLLYLVHGQLGGVLGRRHDVHVQVEGLAFGEADGGLSGYHAAQVAALGDVAAAKTEGVHQLVRDAWHVDAVEVFVGWRA